MSIAILQNFIVTKQERLDTLKETLPDIANYFGDLNFYINYNSVDNFDEVHSLYKENINNLTFYNDLTEDWGRITQSMLSDIEEDYVFIFPEDYKLYTTDTDYFTKLVKELIKYNCDHMIMHRIEDVKCYGINEQYYNLYDTKEYLHLCDSSKYPTSCLSSVAVYKKTFLNEFLTFYNNEVVADRFPLATPNCYEWFSHGNVYGLTGDRLFAIPKRAVVQHYEPSLIKERV